jgi:hypothetical protein
MQISYIAYCGIIRAELIAAAGKMIAGDALGEQLHTKPEDLRNEIQKRIDACEPGGTIVLGYGLCGMAAAGLRSCQTNLVMPKADDCIQILLGSRARYMEVHAEEPGTYFLTNGIIDNECDPLAQLHRQVEKHGYKKCLKLMKRALEGYKRFAYIDTGLDDESKKYWNYTREAAETLGMDAVRLPGSLSILKKLLSCEWDEDFLRIPPGTTITQDMFR